MLQDVTMYEDDELGKRRMQALMDVTGEDAYTSIHLLQRATGLDDSTLAKWRAGYLCHHERTLLKIWSGLHDLHDERGDIVVWGPKQSNYPRNRCVHCDEPFGTEQVVGLRSGGYAHERCKHQPR